MPEPMDTIDNLSKVSLKIQTNIPENGDKQELPFTFIFGANAEGITAFEKALFGKRVGEKLIFEIDRANFCETIGHLANPLREQTGIEGYATMHVRITEITRAEDREVVKAMAGGGSCGDCDCGCGGH